MKIDHEAVIAAYNAGKSMTSIALDFDTYATTIKRILEKYNVELRHDMKRKGTIYVNDGDKLIAWAKAQGRPVTKDELAQAMGRTKISDSYFSKYPELSKYIKSDTQHELTEYYQTLYKWLQDNDIPYKPNDKSAIGVMVDVLLLGDYAGIAMQICEKPRFVSKKDHEYKMKTKELRSEAVGIRLIFLDKKCLKDLDLIKHLLIKK